MIAPRVTYDPVADAAYIYLAHEILPGGVAKTVSVDPMTIGGMVNLDLDAEGRIVGIEVLGAKSRLDPHLLSDE
ncbi:DUF2283 domain-containing protein [Nocardia yamanashiensis]|uniref:DUF2283 domain-containing protein n=1 Tax=Nocardia yamanashiensis TaxID=209247 RepID=UPI001E459FDC|nr:DUF2283 domain-containing protein [Nocardia yamanashiensis]UGT44126.1 DUF2283 domain-containing protein [Nocardia yamanashiensis]